MCFTDDGREASIGCGDLWFDLEVKAGSLVSDGCAIMARMFRFYPICSVCDLCRRT